LIKFNEASINHIDLCYNLIKSSMTGHNLHFYKSNPDKVKMLMMFWNEELIARALLWTTDSGKKVVDELYPHGNFFLNRLEEYCFEKGYDFVVGGRVLSGKKYTITLKNEIKYGWPFLDTFSFTDELDKDIITLSNVKGDNKYALISHEGSYCRIKENAPEVIMDADYVTEECLESQHLLR
jgi:hypothetical protein